MVLLFPKKLAAESSMFFNESDFHQSGQLRDRGKSF